MAKAKRLLAVTLSAVMLASVFSGCKKGDEVPQSSETSAAASALETAETASSAAEKSEEEILKYLENRQRIENGLITEVEAVSMEGKCAAADTEFRITAAEDVSPEEIRARLTVSPEKDFNIVKEKSGTYLLSCTEPFPEGSIVKLAAADGNGDVRDSWAFQTAEEFAVKSVYPADGSYRVSKNSGIEITFTTPALAKDAAEYFEVSPELAGSFETHRSTLYFIPRDNMTRDTVYTVTVKKGMPSAISGELAEDFSFQFKTGHEDNSYFYVYNSEGNFSETFLQGDPAVIEIYCSEYIRNKNFDLNLYRYENAETYRADFEKFAEDGNRFKEFTADVSGLEKVYSSSEPPAENSEKWRPMFIMLPDDLEEGYYIADITVDAASTLHDQYMIQVNPLSVFALMLGEENAFFINDTRTGKSAEGAEVSLTITGKTAKATADKDGVAVLNTGANADGEGVLSVKYGGSEYIDYFQNYENGDIDYEDKYFMYLYTDREMYLTTDTVNVWGIVLPRRDGVTVPKKLSLRFGGSEESGEVKEVDVGSDGTFMSSFSFADRAESWYVGIALLDGENVMCEKRIVIDDYVKPTYKFDVTMPDYAVMPQTNPVPMEISAEFYEGTPAGGLTFRTSEKSDPEVIKTDKNGSAEAMLTFDDDTDWRGRNEYVNVNLTGVENEYSSFYGRVPSFYRDVMIETEYDKSAHSLTLNTTQFDFDKIEEFLAGAKGQSYWSYFGNDENYDILKGNPFDTEVTVKIKHKYSVKRKIGTYYDFIEKKTVDRYDYDFVEDDIGTFTAQTVNGKAVLTNLPTTSMEGTYYFYFTYEDSFGQVTKDNAQYYNYEYDSSYNSSPVKHYYFGAEDNADTYYDYYYYYSCNVNFKENETLEFHLISDKDEDFAAGGKVFFAVYQNDFISQNVYSSQTLKYSPNLDCLPNARYEGAYFDGRHVYPVNGGMIKFDPEERNIKLDVTADKDYYDAGETVRLTVKATDERGNAVAGAPVMLSVADEAAFAVMNQNIDVLEDAYAYIYYPYARNYYSYIQHVIGGDNYGEMGGGGDDGNVRDYFTDNPYFGSVTTNSDGVAEFVFDLADNLTEWRATLIAAKSLETGRIIAGDVTVPIISKRPLFITPIMLSTFIEGDDIAVTAKCTGIDEGDKITVKITGDGVEKTAAIQSAETANFGKLQMGEYKVLFTAEKNGNRDAIELPLTVTDTILETDIYREFDLAEGIDVSPTKYPVNLTFFNKEYMFYTDILRKLAFYYGDRIDSQMAGGFARMELGYITEEEFIEQYKADSGFIKVLPNAGESAEKTALLAAAMPELVNRPEAIAKFNKMIADDREVLSSDISIAYMGLAALGEPVLVEVQFALESGEFYNFYDQMRLTAALALCGDYELAYDYFVQFTPEIVLYDNDPDNVFAFIPGDGQSREYTQIAMAAASLLKLPEADYFARYLFDAPTIQYDTDCFEFVVYLRNYVPETEGEAVFTYNLNGRTETVELERYYGKRLRFGEEQLKNADFKVQSGSVLVMVSYIGRVAEQGGAANISVKKTLSGDFSVGGEVTVKIQSQKWCSVDDVIPSCGRYANGRSDQRISLFTGENGRAEYKFRVVSEGEYVVESAVVQSGSDWGESGRSTVVIGEKNESVEKNETV